ncbi:MAG: iron-sulfur cluster assembly scaffold protein [Candidatus Competibacteraceae bacterium]|nr:iron-sulfur cluster assembly scaffold protein [Candidatus Competibacteraceae bacterium]
MSDLRDLYQEVILDHNKRPRQLPYPRNRPTTPMESTRCVAIGSASTSTLRTASSGDIAFQGAGCAISSASASLMTEALKGKPVAEVDHLFDTFHNVVTTDCDCPKGLGKLRRALAGSATIPAGSNAPPWPGTRCAPRWKTQSRQNRNLRGRPP